MNYYSYNLFHFFQLILFLITVQQSIAPLHLQSRARKYERVEEWAFSFSNRWELATPLWLTEADAVDNARTGGLAVVDSISVSGGQHRHSKKCFEIQPTGNRVRLWSVHSSTCTHHRPPFGTVSVMS